MLSPIAIHTEKSDLIYSKASEYLINCLRLYLNITQKTLLLLSGGSAVNLYRELTEFINKSDTDLSFLALAQVDERFQPGKSFNIEHSTFNKEDTNSYQIEKTGFWKVCRERNIPYNVISQEGTLEKSAQQHNETIEKLFKEYVYKVAILGIGEDGHTAGLLPGYKKLWNWNAYIAGYENNGQFKERITLTPKALKELDQAIVVAKGKKKKPGIQEILNESNLGNLDRYPAALLQEIPKVDLFTDINFSTYQAST